MNTTTQTALVSAELPQDEGESRLLTILERSSTDPNVNVEKMERTFAMIKEMRRIRSEALFNEAMRQAEVEMPVIARDSINSSTSSRYAKLEALLPVIKPVYLKHGFSVTFSTAKSDLPNHIRVKARVSHNAGFSRDDYQVDLPYDSVGLRGNPNKTQVQGAGSTISYGRRYLMYLIWNIALEKEDDDGKGGGIKPQNPDVTAPQQDSDEGKRLRKELWNMFPEEVRGGVQNWNQINKWCWENEVLDGAVPESMPNLPIERLKKLISDIKKKGKI